MAGAEGEEEMLVVDVVQGEHGAAGEQELSGLRLEAKVFERDPQGWLGPRAAWTGIAMRRRSAAQD